MRMWCAAQASAEDGRLVWSPITFVPHRNLEAATLFVVLSTGNGTALTLTGSHIVYVSDAASAWSRKPAPARDVKVRRRHTCAEQSLTNDVCGSLHPRPLPHLFARPNCCRPMVGFELICRWNQQRSACLQVGDQVWSMLPEARTLVPTHVVSVQHVTQTGYVNVHTLQGVAVPCRRPAVHRISSSGCYRPSVPQPNSVAVRRL